MEELASAARLHRFLDKAVGDWFFQEFGYEPFFTASVDEKNATNDFQEFTMRFRTDPTRPRVPDAGVTIQVSMRDNRGSG